jgi:polyketide biosynthesis enoyl-CoA hydratase PksI
MSCEPRLREDGIAVLRLGSDEAPHVGDAEVEQLARAVETIAGDESVRAVVVGGGARHFCMGAARGHLDRPDAGARSVAAHPSPAAAAPRHPRAGGGGDGRPRRRRRLRPRPLVRRGHPRRRVAYGANFVTSASRRAWARRSSVEEALGRTCARELLFTGRLVKGRELRGAVHRLPAGRGRGAGAGAGEEMAAAPRARWCC